jgi:DNA-binding MarR family transcriptional regulator
MPSRVKTFSRRAANRNASPNPQDKRSVIVGLSAEGRERVAATLADRGDVFRARTQDWSDADLSRFVELLARLTSGQHT